MTAPDKAGPDRPKELTQAAADKIFEERRRQNEAEAARVDTKMLLFNKMLAWKQATIGLCGKNTTAHASVVRRCVQATELFFGVIGGTIDSQKFAQVSEVFEGTPPPSPEEVIERLRKL